MRLALLPRTIGACQESPCFSAMATVCWKTRLFFFFLPTMLVYSQRSCKPVGHVFLCSEARSIAICVKGWVGGQIDVLHLLGSWNFSKDAFTFCSMRLYERLCIFCLLQWANAVYAAKSLFFFFYSLCKIPWPSRKCQEGRPGMICSISD